MKHSITLLALAVMLMACSGQAPLSQTSPKPTPSATPPTSAQGPFAVLVTSTAAATYTVSLVNAAGVVAASAQASGLPGVTCGGAVSALVPPPISTSNGRVYFMDGTGAVHFITPAGNTGVAATLPIVGGRRSMFSVSPDDQRIAVILESFSAAGVSTRLYVDDLAQAVHHLIYEQTAATGLWPIGWHGASIVVGVVHACVGGAGLGCCGPTELHVIDPATAARRFTIGGGPCIIAGPSTPSGTPCVDARKQTLHMRDWAGVQFQSAPVNGDPVYLSPDGRSIAFARATEGLTMISPPLEIHMIVCGWIDDTHVVAGEDAKLPARVADVTTGAIVPTLAPGTCAGRLPGGL